MYRAAGVTVLVVAGLGTLGFIGWTRFGSLPSDGEHSADISDAPGPRVQREQGTAGSPGREPRVAVNAATAVLDDPKGTPASPPSSTPRQQTREDENRRFLATALRELETAGPAEQFWCAQRVLITSIAIIMDAAGTSTPTPSGPHKISTRKGTFVFLYNSRDYTVREGEFPEYDEFMKTLQPVERTGPKSIADMGPAGGPRPEPRELKLDAQTIEQIKIRAAEAAAILGSGN